MKKSKRALLLMSIAAAVLAIAVMFAGCGLIQSIKGNSDHGANLDNGQKITYEAVLPEDYDLSGLSRDMETARTVMQRRLEALGYPEAVCDITGDRQLVVKLPPVKDLELTAAELGSKAEISFADADNKIWLTGADVSDASYEKSPTDNTGIARPHVVLKLTEEGRGKLHEASEAVLARADRNTYLAILMDGEQISAPYINEALDTDSVIITVGSQNDPEEQARYLANIISAGHMPFALNTVKLQDMASEAGN